jgi:hypothetical protein
MKHRPTRWVVGVMAASALMMSGCTSQAEVDRVGLKYTGGPLEGKHFDGIVEPGSGVQFVGVFDTVAWLPAGQRNYIVSSSPGEGDREDVADKIVVPAKGGVKVAFELSVYFKLNTRDDVIRNFYEQICKKYHCTEEDGWRKMLNDNFRKIIETSMNERIRQYDVGVLYANNAGAEGQTSNDVLLQVQRDVAQTLRDRVNSVLGGPYFCGPTFNRANPACPDFEFIINSAVPEDPGTVQSFEAIRRSQNEVETAKNRALELQEEAKGEAAKQNALQAAGELTPNQIAYLQAQAQLACANNKDGHCVLVVGGGSVNVNAGR